MHCSFFGSLSVKVINPGNVKWLTTFKPFMLHYYISYVFFTTDNQLLLNCHEKKSLKISSKCANEIYSS